MFEGSSFDRRQPMTRDEGMEGWDLPGQLHSGGPSAPGFPLRRVALVAMNPCIVMSEEAEDGGEGRGGRACRVTCHLARLHSLTPLARMLDVLCSSGDG